MKYVLIQSWYVMALKWCRYVKNIVKLLTKFWVEPHSEEHLQFQEKKDKFDKLITSNG